ncbi:hypothetical protein A3L11_08455 [Thermococcus siculi]|uniref:Uncharacterized protein n=1 Tax=Thermococcus siculi TaxID=72803 RepID=A0A2Z2MU01_9EURY|nr:hypothetical protein [Thermococcus siculi]ASJ09256.1 hypothetical protein A3L11_08455 [Thermococcus siculi]
MTLEEDVSIIGVIERNHYQGDAFIVTGDRAEIYRFTPFPRVSILPAEGAVEGLRDTSAVYYRSTLAPAPAVAEFRAALQVLVEAALNGTVMALRAFAEKFPESNSPEEVAAFLRGPTGFSIVAMGVQLPAFFLHVLERYGLNNIGTKAEMRDAGDPDDFDASDLMEVLRLVRERRIKTVPPRSREPPGVESYTGIHLGFDRAELVIAYPDGSFVVYRIGYFPRVERLSPSEGERFLEEEVIPRGSRWGFIPLNENTLPLVKSMFTKAHRKITEWVNWILKRFFEEACPMAWWFPERVRDEVQRRLKTSLAADITLLPLWELKSIIPLDEMVRAEFDHLTQGRPSGITDLEFEEIMARCEEGEWRDITQGSD